MRFSFSNISYCVWMHAHVSSAYIVLVSELQETEQFLDDTDASTEHSG